MSTLSHHIFVVSGRKIVERSENKSYPITVNAAPNFAIKSHLRAPESLRQTTFQRDFRPQDELVRPGGLPSAILGLIKHCPSQNKSCHTFFDYQNPSVKLLMDKGITAANSYGFDWHWRSEGHERHRRCLVRGYSVELRSIHEVMTRNFTEALSLLLLVISGSCA
jgi:hypothetical protein